MKSPYKVTNNHGFKNGRSVTICGVDRKHLVVISVHNRIRHRVLFVLVRIQCIKSDDFCADMRRLRDEHLVNGLFKLGRLVFRVSNTNRQLSSATPLWCTLIVSFHFQYVTLRWLVKRSSQWNDSGSCLNMEFSIGRVNQSVLNSFVFFQIVIDSSDFGYQLINVVSSHNGGFRMS